MTLSGVQKSFLERVESGAPKLFRADKTRSALSAEHFIQRSMSPVARGRPCAATAYAPTSMNSTLSSQNADNMSRKSEFSKRLSFKGPGIQCELPHHFYTLGGSGRFEIVLVRLLIQLADA